MFEYDIYNDIAARTNGDIYVGVVGPVRSGKSTFISRFMEQLVIPNISEGKKGVAVDELPQSASGKTIMTTEPKFVPSEAVTVNFGKANARVKLIDCVGYLVDGAIGHEEDNQPRLVKTPWETEPMPFEMAAEIGTRKVIAEHSTVGIVITTDGSFTDISRSSYEIAEERVIGELKLMGKPFIIIYNTLDPNSESAKQYKNLMEKKYGVSVVCDNVEKMDKERLNEAFASLLMEFPMRSFDINLPKWMRQLSNTNGILNNLVEQIKKCSVGVEVMKSFNRIEDIFADNENFTTPSAVELDMASGRATISVDAKPGVFYKVLCDESGETIDDELKLLKYVKDLSEAKKNYVKLKGALECASETGYGIVAPTFEDSELSEMDVAKRSGGYCVAMKAKTKCLHIIRTDVETEVNPVYGSKKQCDDFINIIKQKEADECWNTSVFGRPLKNIITDEISLKSTCLSDNIKYKFRKTVNRAVNEKKSNVFCILI